MWRTIGGHETGAVRQSRRTTWRTKSGSCPLSSQKENLGAVSCPWIVILEPLDL